VCGFVDVITCGIVPCALFVFLRAVVLLGVLVFACASVRGSVRASVSARWCCQSLCPSALFGYVCVRVCECARMLFRVCLLVFVCVCVFILVGGPSPRALLVFVSCDCVRVSLVVVCSSWCLCVCVCVILLL